MNQLDRCRVYKSTELRQSLLFGKRSQFVVELRTEAFDTRLGVLKHLDARLGGLTVLRRRKLPDGPLHVLVDSTGLKIYGRGEWLQEKHGARARRTWRKLHLLIEAETHEIVASELTANMVTHARSEGWLRLDLRNNRLTIAVADADPHPPVLRIPGLPTAGGPGLLRTTRSMMAASSRVVRIGASLRALTMARAIRRD